MVVDFSLSREEQELKDAFHAFFAQEMKKKPKDMGHIYHNDASFEFHRYMMERLGEKGWIAHTWPKAYGGQDAPIMHQYLFNMVRAEHGAPGIDTFGVEMFAPTLLLAASEEQKQRLLPPIARGEVVYCQGWSEPNAGSDLASVKTSARLDGDHYVINGQKIWNTGGNYADRMFLLARTNPNEPRGKGVSVFTVSMDVPGIEVRPIEYMDGRGEVYNYNEVFLTDVRVPVADRIGPENMGWKITRETMNFERSGVGGFVLAEKMLKQIIEYAKNHKRGGQLLSKSPVIREKIADLWSQLQAASTIATRIAWLQDDGGRSFPPHYASESKVLATEIIQKVNNLAMEVLGPYGQLSNSQYAPIPGVVEQYMMSVGANIYAGSNEIQRNIIAWAGLRLPRFS